MWTDIRNMTISSKVPPNSFRFFLLKRIAGRLLPVCIVFVCASALTSCDFLRRMAGRPTRAELSVLAQKRDSLELERRLKLLRPGISETAEPVVASDSTQLLALKAGAGATMLRNLSRYKGCGQVQELFYLITGTFKDPSNAERFCARLRGGSFPQAQVLTLGNGYSLTAVYATSRADDAIAFLDAHRAELPPESWFLINDQR